MSDPTRIAVVVAVLLSAAALGWLARRRSAPNRMLGSEHGPFPAALFFGSETCQSCRPAWAAIVAAGLEVRQYTWEHDQQMFEQWGIEEVPLLWIVDRLGRVRQQVTGVPEPRALRRAKSQIARE